jgi:pyruvate-formate lyase-activating enzyme
VGRSRRFSLEPHEQRKGGLLHLVEFLSLRAVPAAGVSLALTRRCPLSCAHCSTRSTLTSEEGRAATFRRFVSSFRPDDRPEVMAMSGGEAFLRPKLVLELAELAREAGSRPTALSGMFWAKARRIPAPIKRAIDALDHFSVSLDAFHEREVERHDVYRVLDTLLSQGMDVSIHLVGLGPDDPYLAERTAEIHRVFDGRVPMLVNGVNAVGRAKDWLEPAALAATPDAPGADPCTLAAWPLVAFDGTIVACGNDDVVDGPAPAHLRLGPADTTPWPEVRRRTVTSSLIRAIRTYGPLHVAAAYGEGAVECNGYCTTCQRLSTAPELEPRVAAAMATPGAAVLEQRVVALETNAGPVSFARRFGMPAYAELVMLGAPRVSAGSEDGR